VHHRFPERPEPRRFGADSPAITITITITITIAIGLAIALVAASCSTGTGGTNDAASRPLPSMISPTRPDQAGNHGSARPAPEDAPQPTVGPAQASGLGRSGIPDSWSPEPLTWTACQDAEHAQCARLKVPLDWRDPDGAQIELALARLPATGPASQRLGTVVLNPGGPGGSGVRFVQSDPLSPALARRFDQLGWDPRGVGDSTSVTCAEDRAPAFLEADPDPDTPEEQNELVALAEAVARDCDRDAGLLAHMGTRDVARDLEAIRRALDDGALNYLGFSYGTQIGQFYAEMFPKQARALVLDGVVDPALSFTQFLDGQIEGFDASFQRSADACRAAGRRRCGVSDLTATYDKVRTRLERSSLVTDGATRRVGPADLAVAAISVAYRDDGWRELGPALADALEGDASDIARLADRYHDLGSYGAYAGVVCTDTPPPPTPDAWKRFADEARVRSPRFGGSVANELLPCATWPVRSEAVPQPVSAPDAPPILVVGNTGDPATPLSNARSVASALSSAVMLTVDRSGHTAYGFDACATRIMDRYLTDLTVPATGSTC